MRRLCLTPLLTRSLLIVCALLCLSAAQAGPLPRDAVPEVLKPWVPWVLHGHETIACPPDWNDHNSRSCLWPSALSLAPGDSGASFELAVESFGALTPVPLPGDNGTWPLDVQVDGKVVAVTTADDQPVVRVSEGRHKITGRFRWRDMPASLAVPRTLAIVRVNTGSGWVQRTPDESGALLLRADSNAQVEAEALAVRSFRHIDDDQPLRVTARFELTFAGKPREIVLDNALLPGFTALSLDSPLPARLAADGSLRLQARPGVHRIELVGRRMDRVQALALPKQASRDEVWSWQAHRALRVVDVAGHTVDPKQTGVPDDWQSLPAYLLHAGDTLTLTERRRGDPEPEPDKLSLLRTVWLDFDGAGYTVQDKIQGTLSRAWRLEAAAPMVLGHVASDEVDQYITRLDATAPAGFETRHGVANIVADSRIEGRVRALSVTGWNTSFQQVTTRLNLPPGWLLLHAGGVDRAQGAWLAAWTLWDFFFVLLIALAAWKTCGAPAGVVLGLALVLTWHGEGAPGWAWLPAIAVIAAGRALATSRLAMPLRWLQGALTALIVAQLLVFAVAQVRLAIYPALEHPAESPAFSVASPAPMQEAAAPAAQAEADGDARAGAPRAAKLGESSVRLGYSLQPSRADVGTQVQTGPGLPQWHWQAHTLSVQGPVSAEQSMKLWLLPPALHALMRLLSLGLLLAALALVLLRGRVHGWAKLASTAAPVMVVALCLGVAGLVLTPATAWAETRAEPSAPGVAATEGNWQSWLDALRDKLLAAPDCMPGCAQIAHLSVDADAKVLRLRLEAHAAERVALPLPGQAAQLRILSVLLDGQPASLRRDDEGTLWLHLPAGVHQVVMEADVADAPAVNIALPLAPHALDSHLAGWTLAGVDDSGAAQGALTLNRIAGAGKAASETTRDALPPLVRVLRTLRLTDRWEVMTQISRIAPSQAPLQVEVALLAGEQVTDSSIRVVQGKAYVTLGAASDAQFSSVLPIGPALTLQATAQPNQIEQWRLQADTRWHIGFKGLAPVQHQEGQYWLPLWQPWPGDSVRLEVSRPQGVPGASLTLDSLNLSASPGARMTEVTATLMMRASLGGNHGVLLPEGATLQAVSIDGVAQPLRAEARKLSLPIRPGSQRIEIRWREPRGVSALQRSAQFDVGLAGVNATTTLELGQDRWILAVGGPRMGPAVLLWGPLLIVLFAAWCLGRSRLTPLRFGDWVVLGLGVAQASILGAALVAAWLMAMAVRGRGTATWPRSLANLVQIGLVCFSLVALAVLFEAIRTGLLGTPNMLVAGNGSYGRSLIWYQDRFSHVAPSGWVFSLSLWVYRGLMLLWALWLAAAVVKWSRWAWLQWSAGGLWRPAPPRPATPVPAQDKATQQ